MGLAMLFPAGCRKEEPSSARAPAAAGAKGEAVRGKLAELRGERNDLLARRAAVVEQMKAKVDAAKAALKTDDEKLVKAALEKDPEWASLHARCVDLNTALGEQRQKTMGVVREAIAPEKGAGGQASASAPKARLPENVRVPVKKISK